MHLQTYIFTVIWISLCRAANIADFEAHILHNSNSNYVVIFHADHHLLLVIHGDRCDFIYVPPEKVQNLNADPNYLTSRRNETLEYMLHHIGDPSIRSESSLEEMRNKYQDVLADFHCMGKQVFEVELFHSSGTVISTTEASTGPPEYYVCLQQPNGLYAYPGDCTKFVHCVTGTSYVQNCPDGLFFTPTTGSCQSSCGVPVGR